MSYLLLTRHGQSEFNLQKRFTGWLDVELTDQGRVEAQEAALLVKPYAQEIDHAFTSGLKRAQHTLEIIINELKLNDLPVTKHSALNERHYGDLQGRVKDQCREEFGAEQVHIWRRSFNTPPPGGESLEQTAQRTWPYFEQNILPLLKEDKNILITAHGNSLRSIIMHLENLDGDAIVKREIKTGELIAYEYSQNKFNKINTTLER